jgi:hypothetical protein
MISSQDKGEGSRATETPESEFVSIPAEKDLALQIAGEHAQEYDKAAEARVVRKIDLVLIPAMTIGMF